MNEQLKQRLMEIEAREKATKPGLSKSEAYAFLRTGVYFAPVDSEFLSNCVDDIPWLTSELRKAYEALECAREGLDKISSPHPNPGTLSDLEMLELFSDISGETIAQIAKILEER